MGRGEASRARRMGGDEREGETRATGRHDSAI